MENVNQTQISALTRSMRTWVEINLDCIQNNFSAAKKRVSPETKIAVVIKADAYGHGAVRIAKELYGQGDFFAVASSDEAAELRIMGIETPILILGYVEKSDYKYLMEQQIRITVFDYNNAKQISDFAVEQGLKAIVHIAVDTGMGRIGLSTDKKGLEDFAKISSLPGIIIEGIFSHFAESDGIDDKYSKMQTDEFDYFCERAKEIAEIQITHLFNSAAIWKYQNKYDMVRLGVLLYGLCPSKYVDVNPDEIKQAMSLKTRVSFVKKVYPGQSISYGHTYTASKTISVATLCAGYADGVPRQISGKGYVLIHGKKARILGRVCMDQMMVDVTKIPECIAGDEAIIFGYDGDRFISVDEIAEMSETIGYTVICGISKRVPKVYIKDGKVDSIAYGIPHVF